MQLVVRHEEKQWGPAGIVLAMVIVAEIAFAIAVIATGAAQGGAAMLVAGALAFVSIILVMLAPMPWAIRIVLMLAIATTALMLSVTLDPLGVSRTEREVTTLLDAPEPSNVPDAETGGMADTASMAMRVRMAGTVSDPEFAQELRQRVAELLAGRVALPARDVVVRIDPAEIADSRRYQINVTLRESGGRWCGALTIVSLARAAVIDRIARWIAKDIEQTKAQASACV